VNVKRTDALKDRLHHSSSVELHIESPGGAFEQTSLMVVLEAIVRDPGEGRAPN
jgi:hypothetical protein